MSFILNIFTILVLGIFSFKTFALESSDQFSTQILKMYNKNILVLNRGLEDGIFKKDHIKLTNQEGFIARGICIKTTLLTSHWKIYRVVRPQLVSMDSLYTLNAINQSEIPADLIKYSKVDFTRYFKDFGDEDVSKEVELQQQRIAHYDLPEDAKSTPAFKEVSKSDFDKFVETTFSDKELKEDLSKFYLNIFASPLSYQTRYNQKEVHYGANLYNIAQRYQFNINSIETQRRILNPVTKEGYESKSSHHDFSFQFNHITDHFSITSYLSYDREKIGNIYYPYRYTQVALLGLKLHVWEQDPKDNFFEISYAPSFDSMEFSDPNNLDQSYIQRQGIRHRIRAKIYADLTDRIHSKTDLLYMPLASISSEEYQFNDNQIRFSQTFSYNLGASFFADYLVQYEVDELRAKVYDISEHNTTQTFRMRYEFDI